MTDLGGNLRRALILAAGYGTRLAPVTDYLPKPLLPVDGVPLLDHIIDRVLAAGVDRVGVNSHHLGELVAAHLAGHAAAERLVCFPESEILGTGGPLHNAREFLGAAPSFLIHNGDVLCAADLPALWAAHEESGALATLLLADWPEVNSVLLGVDGAVRHIGGTGEAPAPAAGDRSLTYTGICVCDRRLLDLIGPGFSSLITPLVNSLAATPGSVRGWAPAGLQWDDLGTLARWLQAAGTEAQTSDGFCLERITGHGSDRRFWRLGQGDWSAVAMQSPPDDDEFARFLAIGSFLAAHDLGAARQLAVDRPAQTVLLEDLGPSSLHALATDPGRDPAVVRQAYEQVVDRLLALQALTPVAATECPLAVDRTLGLDQLRWETSYFRDRYLHGHLGLTAAQTTDLEPEFAALADSVARQPLVLLHRDFQSQNILLPVGGVGLVDYQGLRLGPLGYDLASLIWDPYVELPGSLRQDLVRRFAAACPAAEAAALPALVVTAGLQRVMQALGAYGFLGHQKMKPAFLDHIPAGLDHLRQLLAALQDLQRQPAPREADWLPVPLLHLTALVAE